METYTIAANASARIVTQQFSTSFSLATRLFPKEIRQAIYNIYGMVRIADEIVDTYKGSDTLEILDAFEQETLAALSRGYSSNIIIHAFAQSARQYAIGPDLITPFFESMKMDTQSRTYSQELYEKYIYGSAEVVGLMCLKVFCNGEKKQYTHLRDGAGALGAAFQKVNFLRDIADDQSARGRYYFPAGSFDTFDEKTKGIIIQDIKRDMTKARQAIKELPKDVRKPVAVAYRYYEKLLVQLESTPANIIKKKRVRVSDYEKYALFLRSYIGGVV